jgi:hypothetical protein
MSGGPEPPRASHAAPGLCFWIPETLKGISHQYYGAVNIILSMNRDQRLDAYVTATQVNFSEIVFSPT